MKGTPRFLLVCVLVFGTLTAAQAEPRTIPTTPSEDYIHSATRFSFPPFVGEFERNNVVQYDNDGKDIGAGYFFHSLRINATVYVYPVASVPEQKLKAHFEACKLAISKHPQTELVEEGPAQISNGTKIQHGMKAAYQLSSTEFRCFEKGEPLHSELYLFPLGTEWSIKFRITYPQSQTKAATEAVSKLLNGFTWPESPATSAQKSAESSFTNPAAPAK